MSNNAPYVLAQKELLLQGGSKDSIDAQHSAGKQTARERINALIDDSTFVEIDVFAKSRATNFNTEVPCEGLVAGFGTVNGSPVYVYSQDYTVMKGSVGQANGDKICKVMKMAAESGVPVIGILDSAGARVGEGVDALNAFAKVFNMSATIKGIIPQINLVLGPCIGASAIAARISDVVLGVDGISSMGAHSAYVYDAVAGKADGTDICSAQYCASTSGLLDAIYADEKACFDSLKDLLSYLPSSCCDVSAVDCVDDLNRETPSFDAFLGAEYDVLDVVTQVADNGAFFELGKEFGKTIVTGFARMNGKTIGIVANQAKECDGFMDVAGIKKTTDFIEKCDYMGISILTLVDNKGLCSCTSNEENGVVVESSKLVQAYANSSVPKVALILNNAIGSGYAMMASKGLGVDMVYSWPSAVISPLSPEASSQILADSEVSNPQDFAQYVANPINAAQSGLIDDIIDPISTRPIIAAAFEMLGFASSC